MVKRKRLSIDIDEELHHRIKVKAALEGRTISEVAISLLDTWIKLETRKEERGVPGAKRKRRGRRR